ncbi:VOC family protein [Antrihabitans stalagmiti]|nr:VOC family protein [Antrihabitans stalagmiti]
MSKLVSSYAVLMTADVAAAARFYRENFGYETTFEADWYVSLARGQHELALLDPDHPTIPEAYRGRTAAGVLLNLEVDDVDEVHFELAGRPGIEIVLSLRDEDFGQRHFIVAGPDGVLVDVITPIPPVGDFADQFVD